MIIDEIEITNFKSHRSTRLSFSRITNFIGVNDAGKSSCSYIPLKLVLLNRNWPDRTITKGEKQSTITVKGKGIEITRERTKTQALSITKNGKTETYTGKKGLNEQIAEQFGIRKVVLDEGLGEEDLNFIPVKAGAFILDKSPEVVRRKVSGILGLNEAEATLKELKDQEKKSKKDLEALKSTKEKFEDSLDEVVKRRAKLGLEIEQEVLKQVKVELELGEGKISFTSDTLPKEQLQKVVDLYDELDIIDAATQCIIDYSAMVKDEAVDVSLMDEINISNAIIDMLVNLEDLGQDIGKLEQERMQMLQQIKVVESQIEELGEDVCPECGQLILDI